MDSHGASEKSETKGACEHAHYKNAQTTTRRLIMCNPS